MAHPLKVGDLGEPAGEAGPAPPASPPAHGPEALQLLGGVPGGFLTPAGVDDGGDGGLVADGDRLAQGEQDAGTRGGWQGWYPGRLGCPAVGAGGGPGPG